MAHFFRKPYLRLSAFFLMLLFLSSAVGCAKIEYRTARVYAMGTLCAFTVSGSTGEDGDATGVLVPLLHDTEALLSHKLQDSLPDRLAKEGRVSLTDARLEAALRLAEELRLKTDGRFSVLVYPITSLWNFNAETPVPPTQDALTAALGQMADASLRFEDGGVVGEGARLDLGAIGKGYAADVCADALCGRGESGLIAIGGSIAAVGGRNESAWQIGVRDPYSASQSDTLGVLSLTDAFVSTSGSYEKMFTYEGKTYHHILDPRTGMPAESDLVSVTVVANSGVLSDALSTACFLVGEDAAFALAEEYGASLVTVTAAGRLCVSEGLRDVFSPADGWEVIYR